MVALPAEWQMLFNVAKCTVLHIGRANPTYQDEMKCIDQVDAEKDPGALISGMLRAASECTSAV